MRRCAAVAVAVLAVVASVSCSKEDSGIADAGSSDRSDTTVAEVDDTTSTSRGSTEGTDHDGQPGAVSADRCLAATELYALILGAAGAVPGVVAEDRRLELDARIAELEGSVPQELRQDFDTLADAYERFMALYADSEPGDALDRDFQKDLAEKARGLETPEVEAAGNNLRRYFERECR